MLFHWGILFFVLAIACFVIYKEQIPIIKAKPIFNYDIAGFTLGTHSMEPTIHPNTKVYYVLNFTITVGNIYVYHIPQTDEYIIHRLIYRDGDLCLFKGDYNLYVDPKVNCSYIVQKVVGLEYDAT